MIFSPSPILREVIIIEADLFPDNRGYFMETYHQEKFTGGGIDIGFVQDNQSMSIKGTLRGLHYQIKRPQGKLVRVLYGKIFDVSVDIRRSSP
ncbi:MAG: dTDP-4-dehydrorhamnose 3,5-epimerase family protein, partial [Desulfatiglandales bacterium]